MSDREVRRAVVVIPTTGVAALVWRAVASAIDRADVLLVADTPEAYDAVHTPNGERAGVYVARLPFRVGGSVYAGHRIYAAAPHLTNHEIVAFLDEDNWYMPSHLPSVLRAFDDPRVDVVWSHRRIHNRDGAYICDDTCESLGPWRVGVGGRRLVDTSCWSFRRAWLESHAHKWAAGWGADAEFTNYVARTCAPARVARIAEHSVCYRLGASERSPTAEFFVEGNARSSAERERAQSARG